MAEQLFLKQVVFSDIYILCEYYQTLKTLFIKIQVIMLVTTLSITLY
jgi:hypothetical protein